MNTAAYRRCLNKIIDTLTHDVVETIGFDHVAKYNEPLSSLHAYWGVEPVDLPSIGCLLPLLKIRDCVNLKIQSTILLADVHAMFNNNFDPRITNKVTFYKFLFHCILGKIGKLHRDSYKIVVGSDIQLNKTYMLELFGLMKITTIEKAKEICHDVIHDDVTKYGMSNANKEDKDDKGNNKEDGNMTSNSTSDHNCCVVVKAVRSDKVSSLVYPLMQIIDEAMLKANIQIGNAKQKEIYKYAQSVEVKKRAYLIHETINCDITFIDSHQVVKDKCANMDIDECWKIVKYIVIPINGLFYTYCNIDHLKIAFADGEMTIDMIRDKLADSISEIIEPIRNTISQNNDLVIYGWEGQLVSDLTGTEKCSTYINV